MGKRKSSLTKHRNIQHTEVHTYNCTCTYTHTYTDGHNIHVQYIHEYANRQAHTHTPVHLVWRLPIQVWYSFQGDVNVIDASIEKVTNPLGYLQRLNFHLVHTVTPMEAGTQ